MARTSPLLLMAIFGVVVGCGRNSAPPSQNLSPAVSQGDVPAAVSSVEAAEPTRDSAQNPDVSATAVEVAPPASPVEIAAAGPEEAGPPPAPERVALLMPGGPLIMDVWLTIDGKPHRAAFEATVDQVLKAADTDGDGRSTWKELYANRDYLGQSMPNAPTTDSRQMKALVERYDENRDGQVQRGEAAAWLGRDAGLSSTPFALRSSRTYRPLPHAASQIWQLLDVDNNGRLSMEEIDWSSATLLSLDADDDWTVSPPELVSLREQLEAAAPRRMGANYQMTHYAAIELDSSTDIERLAYLLSDLYAAGQPLRPHSFPELAELADQLDADGDGWIVQDELSRLQSIEPHVELSVSFNGVADAGARTARLKLKSDAARVMLSAQPLSDRVVLALGATRLIISAHDLTPQQSAQATASQPVQQSAGRSQIRLMVHDQCDALFQALDENTDGRLGEREIAGCVDRLTEWDTSGEGELTNNELPYCMIVAFLRGERAGEQSFYVPTSPAAAVNGESPSWFPHADLNGDGEISRREFLGPFEQFYALDADGNGYVNAAEAAAAESETSPP